MTAPWHYYIMASLYIVAVIVYTYHARLDPIQKSNGLP